MVDQKTNMLIEPSIIVIFGMTGDLSRRKLIPALYRLLKNNLLHENTRIIGITRRHVTTKDLLADSKTCILEEDGECDDVTYKKLTRIIHMHRMSMVEDDDYVGLQEFINELESKQGICLTRLFYLAIPPQILQPVVRRLGTHGLNKGCSRHGSDARLLLEKPFGFDTTTAKELIATTTEHFKESQIFRIDHYLAKETVQNILAFRFQNPIFETLWNAHHIESISVIGDEKIDIEDRADFYEQTGATRDLIQSHLLHVMAVVMMEKPADALRAASIHKARLELLDSIEAVPADKISERSIRGQYKSYRNKVDKPNSHVETFAALKLFSNAERWKDVPIIVRTGKALNTKQTAVEVIFRPTEKDSSHTNTLTFHIQPNEGISINLWVKRPGFERELQAADMSFAYSRSFADINPDAYERVLIDAIRGDNTLFATSNEVLSAWRIIDPVIASWSGTDDGLIFYDKGSSGNDLSVNLE